MKVIRCVLMMSSSLCDMSQVFNACFNGSAAFILSMK